MPTKTIFTSEDGTQELEVFLNTEEKLFISVSNGDYNDSFIVLDLETARLLLEEIQKELNSI